MIDNSYFTLLKQIDEAIDAYGKLNPQHNVSARIIVNATDATGNSSSMKHEFDRGNTTLETHTQDYELPIPTQPDDINTLIDCSIALMTNGSFEAAIDQAKEAVRLQPNNPNCHVTLWRALRADGENGLAYAAIAEALRIYEGMDLNTRMSNATLEIDTRESCAQWLYLLGRTNEARTQTNAAIELAERTGLKDRLDWLKRQLEQMDDAPKD